MWCEQLANCSDSTVTGSHLAAHDSSLALRLQHSAAEHSFWRCVAACRSVSQRVAACHSVLQCVVVCCSVSSTLPLNTCSKGGMCMYTCYLHLHVYMLPTSTCIIHVYTYIYACIHIYMRVYMRSVASTLLPNAPSGGVSQCVAGCRCALQRVAAFFSVSQCQSHSDTQHTS